MPRFTTSGVAAATSMGLPLTTAPRTTTLLPSLSRNQSVMRRRVSTSSTSTCAASTATSWTVTAWLTRFSASSRASFSRSWATSRWSRRCCSWSWATALSTSSGLTRRASAARSRVSRRCSTSSSATRPLTASMRRTPAATLPSFTRRMLPISAVLSTWVPPQSSMLSTRSWSPMVTTRTLSPYFSVKKARAPSFTAWS